MHRIATTLLAIVGISVQARAQIGRRPAPAPEPKTWMSFSVGVMDLSGVHDGSTQSDWEFGNAVQYRVSLELPIQYQSTVGISGSFAPVPPTYTQLGVGTIGCPSQCDADATVTSLMATFHAGGRGGIGFHQIIDISIGATGYSAFRARGSGEQLPPRQLDADLSGGIGYGFGYAFSPDVQITLVQEGFLTVHQRTGVGASENTLGRQFILRLGTRFGF